MWQQAPPLALCPKHSIMEGMSSSLPNYIKYFRRRSRLSQDEVAELLGLTSGTTVLRHEDDQRAPSLDRALAYSVVFKVDARDLFSGRFEIVEDAVHRRARKLLLAIVKQPQTPETARKAAYLAALVNDPGLHYVPCDEA